MLLRATSLHRLPILSQSDRGFHPPIHLLLTCIVRVCVKRVAAIRFLIRINAFVAEYRISRLLAICRVMHGIYRRARLIVVYLMSGCMLASWACLLTPTWLWLRARWLLLA